MGPGLPTADAFLFDSGKLKKFLYQVAAARAAAHATSATWSDYRSSTVLNAIYGLKQILTLGHAAGPGFVEVHSPEPRKLRQEINQYYPRLWREFAEKARQGPMPMKAWLDAQQAKYADDMRYLQRVFQQARQINQQVDEALRVIIFRLAEIRFASEIALNIAGLIPGGGTLGLAVRLGVGLGYPILVNLVDNWSRAGAVQMLLSTSLTVAAQSLPSAGTEDVVVQKAQAILVDKPSLEAARLRAMRKLPGGWKGARVKHAVLAKQADAAMASLGIKVTTAGLQALACWFCYKSCQESAEQFWKTLEAGALN